MFFDVDIDPGMSLAECVSCLRRWRNQVKILAPISVELVHVEQFTRSSTPRVLDLRADRARVLL